MQTAAATQVPKGADPSAGAAPPAPTDPRHRLPALDIVRGVAMFGVVVVNVQTFVAPAATALDRAVDAGISVLVADKFYPLLAVLIGLGLAMVGERPHRRRTARFAWRLLLLFGIGAAHMLFVWGGDILMDYAYAGVVLVAVSALRSSRGILIAAALCLSLSYFGPSLSQVVTRREPVELAPEERQRQAEERAAQRAERERALREGTYAEVVRARVPILTNYFGGGAFPGFILTYGGYMVLGLYAGRRRVHADPDANRGLLRGVVAAGLLVGLPASILGLVGPEWLGVSLPIGTARVGKIVYDLAPLLGFGYAAALLLLLRDARWIRRLRALAPLGRLSLTTYLLHSIVFTTVFYGYGLGYYRQVGPTTGFVLGLAVFGFLMAFSVWWSRRFLFGPIEWLWRSATYGGWQPLMRSPGVATESGGDRNPAAVAGP